jgi:hypothetical protein
LELIIKIRFKPSFLSGAGTGKFRNADKFQKTALECLSNDMDSELKKWIQSAWVFKVGFENGDRVIIHR